MTSATTTVPQKKGSFKSNANIQMDDFLALAREPAPVKKPIVEVKKVPIVVEEVKEPSENAEEEGEGETEEIGNIKKKRDRNAALAPKKKLEDPKKAKKLETIKKKKDDAELEAKRYVFQNYLFFFVCQFVRKNKLLQFF